MKSLNGSELENQNDCWTKKTLNIYFVVFLVQRSKGKQKWKGSKVWKEELRKPETEWDRQWVWAIASKSETEG